MPSCPNCNEPIIGRSDKKFCSVYCKSLYHYRKNKEKNDSLFHRIDKQLKRNRQVLKSYNKSGKTIVRKDELIKEGFNPKFFTHYWKTKDGRVYLFCYEFGFIEKKEEHALKYLLVHWQSYMNK